MNSQLNWTKYQLKEHGRVTRNQALENYFSRLGARIADLREDGWEIEGHFEKTEKGKDYVYTLVAMPEDI